jgi:hypothetical protein
LFKKAPKCPQNALKMPSKMPQNALKMPATATFTDTKNVTLPKVAEASKTAVTVSCVFAIVFAASFAYVN